MEPAVTAVSTPPLSIPSSTDDVAAETFSVTFEQAHTHRFVQATPTIDPALLQLVLGHI